MPDKLTDNEIVKAVKSYEEKILANGIKSLEPFEVREIVERQQEEINRLQEKDKTRHKVFETKCEELEIVKAENERLEKENKHYAELEQGCYVTGVKNIKAEAYKEFAERLKNKYKPYVILGSEVAEIEIDNLLKELVGEDSVAKN